MTFEEMLQKHEKQLADFYKQMEVEFRKLKTKSDLSQKDIQEFNIYKGEVYKKLVSDTYKEATEKLEEEKEQKKLKGQIKEIISEAKENSLWVEEGPKKGIQISEKHLEQAKQMLQTRNKEKEKER